MTQQQIRQRLETACDGIFEANNHWAPKNTASAKLEKLPGEPGTAERIAAYAEKIANGETLFE